MMSLTGVSDKEKPCDCAFLKKTKKKDLGMLGFEVVRALVSVRC